MKDDVLLHCERINLVACSPEGKGRREDKTDENCGSSTGKLEGVPNAWNEICCQEDE